MSFTNTDSANPSSAYENGVITASPDIISEQFSEFRLAEEVFSPRVAAPAHGSRFVSTFFVPEISSRKGFIMTAKNDLLSQIENLHITEQGSERIRKNLSLDTTDVMSWCKSRISNSNGAVSRIGKNWYAESDGYVITINANSKTIITAHKKFTPYYLR